MWSYRPVAGIPDVAIAKWNALPRIATLPSDWGIRRFIDDWLWKSPWRTTIDEPWTSAYKADVCLMIRLALIEFAALEERWPKE